MKLYSESDLGTRDKVMFEISRADSSKYATIEAYASEIKAVNQTLFKMGLTVPEWMLNTFFRMGLEESLAPLLFTMIQGAKGKQEPSIDDMAAVIGQHDRMIRDKEENQYAFAARFGKQDKPGKGKPPTTPPTTDSSKKDEKKDRCTHCNYTGHKKNKCYFLNPVQRPEGWKPSAGKEPLMKENLKKSNKATVQNQDEDDSIPIKSFAVKQKSINTDIAHDVKEDAVYMDTASDVHTLWDRTKFMSYKPCNDSLSGINGQCLRVEGTGSVRYPTIVDGKLDQIILTNVHHVPGMDYNLLSVATLEQKGCSATIANGRFDIMDSGKEKVLSGTRVGTSYLLDLKYSKTPHALKSSYNHPANHCSWDEWHQRLAHLNMQDVKKLATMSEGINVDEVNRLQKLIPDHKLCELCMMGKQTKEPSRQPRRQNPNKRETVKGAFVHSDLAGGGLIK